MLPHASDTATSSTNALRRCHAAEPAGNGSPAIHDWFELRTQTRAGKQGTWLKASYSFIILNAAMSLTITLPQHPPNAYGDTIQTMHSRMLQIVVAIALLICLVCPLVDMFDHWDHAFQTGNETEYNLVVVALCVGVGVSLAQLFIRFLSLSFARDLGSNLTVKKALWSGEFASFFVVPVPLSPPPLALRI